MENVIIIAIIAVLIFMGIKSGRKHFRGEGGCCGGGSYTPKPKKLKHVIAQKTFKVEGMTCEHCKSRVEQSINDIPGAAGRVKLKKKEVIVSMEKEISDEEIRVAIEKAGYKVLE